MRFRRARLAAEPRLNAFSIPHRHRSRFPTTGLHHGFKGRFVKKKDFQYTHVAMPLNSLHRTRTLPDDTDGLRANRDPLIEQTSTLRKSYFYTNLPYGPISTHDPTRALSKALERVSDDAQDKAVAPVEMDSRSSMH